MGREGRKFKICSSCLLLLFTMMIIYFGETTVRRVKEDIKQWNDDEYAKQLITQKINLEYNLKKALFLREHLEQLLFVEIDKYHSEAIDELSEEGMNSINHIINEDRIWDAIVTTSFRLRSSSQADTVTKQEWEDTIEYFSYSLTNEDREKSIKDQNLIFNKIAGKKNAQSITLKDYKKTMSDFQTFLKKVFSQTEVLKEQHAVGRLIFTYVSFEIALYNDCHRKTNDSNDVNKDLNERCYDQKEANKFFIWVLGDQGRWRTVSEGIFNILDINQDGIVEATEIDYVLGQLEFQDNTIRGIQERFITFYDRSNNRQITKEDFLQVMDRVRFLLQKYEEEMGNLQNDDD